MTTPARRPIAFLLGMGILLVGLGGGLGFLTGRLFSLPPRSFPVLFEAFDLVKEQYLGPLPDAAALDRAAVRGLVQSLADPYSLLVDPAGRELETDTLTGEYGGIGADTVRDASGLVRLIPFEGGPAERAGIHEGDVLLAIDNADVAEEWSTEEITSRLRGIAGTTVRLMLSGSQEGDTPRSVELVRETFPLPTVSTYLFPDDNRIGVVRMSLFSAATPGEVDRGLQTLSGRGAAAFVLDLRGNPGGLLDSAVDTARLFLAEGIVAAEVRVDGNGPTYSVETPGRWANWPLAMVVDGNTASAAEVLAGALQQHARGPLAGQTTLGKGTVQSIFVLADGSSLHLTTARWTLPDGEPMPPGGLVPDLAIDLDEADPDVSLRAAADWLIQHGMSR